jgi:hypothetical protein
MALERGFRSFVWVSLVGASVVPRFSGRIAIYVAIYCAIYGAIHTLRGKGVTSAIGVPPLYTCDSYSLSPQIL